VSSCWPYAHDKFEDEVFTKNAQDWDEVVARMVDPKMTRFKAMSLDEQETILEQLETQGYSVFSNNPRTLIGPGKK
jgi:hypothetical protein